MLAEIAAGLEALKAATGLVKVLNTTSTDAQINEVKIGLQHSLLEAQSALFAAQQAEAAATARIHDLEQEIVKLKDWVGEKKNYQLKNIDPKSVAYVPKPGMEDGEAPYWLCTNCFENGKKSHLQFQRNITGHGPALSLWRCNHCKGELSVEWFYSPTKPWTPPPKAV